MSEGTTELQEYFKDSHPYEKLNLKDKVYKPYQESQLDYRQNQQNSNEKKKAIVEWVHNVIPEAPIHYYVAENTPFDQFDSKCHKQKGFGIANYKKRFEQDDLIFLINIADQVKRPEDMLMFLGEYFKENIWQSQTIKDNIRENKDKGQKKLTVFFLTYDILNFFGTACKLYIQEQRHELRISIALARNPKFNNQADDIDNNCNQYLTLTNNITDLQIEIIKRCLRLYKFIDYIADRRRKVPLKFITSQPPPHILSAMFCKMKADYLRYIYEAVSGANGLLHELNQQEQKFKEFSFESLFRLRSKSDISEDNIDDVNCDIYEQIFQKRSLRQKGIQSNIKDIQLKNEIFYQKKMTLQAYLQHEVIFEYEKAKKCFFDDYKQTQKQIKITDIIASETAEFHPVFLSSLLNQTAFIGDVLFQQSKIEIASYSSNIKNQITKQETLGGVQQGKWADVEDNGDIKIKQELKKDLNILTSYVQKWRDRIELDGYIPLINDKGEQETAWQIEGLLERVMETWKI